jgi:malate dehydrogenase (oxaloacetate-decarboxylating)
VLGLENIGPEGAIPVMEGKSVLFKILGGINAIPLCISTQDKEEIVRLIKSIEPYFGAINIQLNHSELRVLLSYIVLEM